VSCCLRLRSSAQFSTIALSLVLAGASSFAPGDSSKLDLLLRRAVTAQQTGTTHVIIRTTPAYLVWAENIVWSDNIVWADDIVWGDTIVWSGSDNRVWGDLVQYTVVPNRRSQ
jgi:hypothetical protein